MAHLGEFFLAAKKIRLKILTLNRNNKYVRMQ